MIKMLKVLFKKKRDPYDVIKSHINIFENHIRYWSKNNEFSSPSHYRWKLAVKIGEQEEYLNRFLNNEFHTDIFNYHLEPVINMDGDFSFMEITGVNLKSELVILSVPYNKIQTLKKNYKKHTYIIIGKNVNIGNIEVYTKRAVIDNKEIYVLKGNEDGI